VDLEPTRSGNPVSLQPIWNQNFVLRENQTTLIFFFGGVCMELDPSEIPEEKY